MTPKTRIAAAVLAALTVFGAASLTSCGGSAPKKEKLEHVYDYTAVSIDRSMAEYGFENVVYYDGRIYFSTYGELDVDTWGQIFMSIDETGSDLKKYDIKKADRNVLSSLFAWVWRKDEFNVLNLDFNKGLFLPELYGPFLVMFAEIAVVCGIGIMLQKKQEA